MAELGTYYITIMPEMSKFTGKVRSALGSSGDEGGKSFSSSFGDVLRGSAIGTVLGDLASRAGSALMDGLHTGIGRLDTIENFPKVMQNLGYSSDEASAAIKRIQDHLDGLPTSTQDMVTLTQAISDSTGDLDLASKAALGFNDMMLANGASTAEMTNAQAVLNRILGKGSATAAQWSSLTAVMPAQLNAVAREMLGAGASSEDLHAALEDGTVSWNDFLRAIVKLDQEGSGAMSSFEQQARANSNGIQTAIDNIPNRIGAGWAKILEVVGRTDISNAINGLSSGAKDAMYGVADGLSVLKGKIADSGIGEGFQHMRDSAMEALSGIDLTGLISGVEAGIDNFIALVSPVGDIFAEAFADPATQEALQHLADLLGVVANVAGTILGAAIQALAAYFAGLIVTVSKVINTVAWLVEAIVGGVTGGAATVQSVWETITAFLTTAWETIGTTASTVFGGLGEFLSTLWTNVQAAAQAAWDAIGGLLSAAWEGISAAAQAAWGGIQALIEGAWTVIRTIIEGTLMVIVTIVATAWNTIMTLISVPLDLIVFAVTTAWGAISSATQLVWETVSTFLQEKWDALVALVTPVFDGVRNAITTVWDAVSTATQTAWNTVSPFLQGVWQGLVDRVTPVFDGIKTAITTVWDAVSSATQTVWNGIKGFIEPIWNWFKDNPTIVWDTIKSTIGGAWDNIRQKTSDVWNGIKGFIEPIWNWLKTHPTAVWDTIKSTIGGAWDSVRQKTSDIWNNIKSSLSSAWDGIKSAARDKFNQVKDAITQPFRDAWNAIKDIPGNIARAFSNIRIQIPHINLPHFRVSWFNVGGMVNLPSIGIDWYAKGGIFDRASLVGIGEAGREAALPLNRRSYGEIARGIAREGAGDVTVTGTFYVREEADIERIADELARKVRRQRA